MGMYSNGDCSFDFAADSTFCSLLGGIDKETFPPLLLYNNVVIRDRCMYDVRY